MKIFVLSAVNAYAARMDLTHYRFLQHFANIPDVKILDIGDARYRHGMSLQEAVKAYWGDDKPDIILHDFLAGCCLPYVSQIHDTGIPVGLWTSDTCDFSPVLGHTQKMVAEYQFDFIFSCFPSDKESVLPFAKPGTLWYCIPEAVDTSTFHHYSEPKQYDFLIYGSIWPGHYPLRNRLDRLLRGQPDIRYFGLQHPGYFDDGNVPAYVIRGERLSRLINSSWLTLATGATGYPDLILPKHMEIAASYSGCIYQDGPHVSRLFGNAGFPISMEMSDDQLVATIKIALSDKERITRYAAKAATRVQRDHAVAARGAQIITACAEILAR